jgi:hypothetical protein
MIYGFATAEDVQRIAATVLAVEGQRPPDRGRSGRNPAIADVRVAFGKTEAASTKATFASPGAGVTVSVWTSGDNFASFVDSGDDITAWNFWGNISSGKQVLCVQTLWGWIVICAEC